MPPEDVYYECPDCDLEIIGHSYDPQAAAVLYCPDCEVTLEYGIGEP